MLYSRLRFAVVTSVLAAASVAMVLALTRNGIGVTPDSVFYFGGASNLAAGNGYSMPDGDGILRPITLWPPLYSLILSLPMHVGIEPVDSAQWLNALLLAAGAAITAVLVREMCGVSSKPWLCGLALYATAPATLLVHTNAWTEPLFVVTGFSGLLSLYYCLKWRSFVLLLVGAALVSLSCMVRYAGAAFVLTGLIVILGMNWDHLRRRISAGVIFAAVAAVLPAYDSLSSFLTSPAEGRRLVWHPPGVADFDILIRTIGGWLAFPGGFGPLRALPVIAVVGLLAVVLWQVLRDEKPLLLEVHPLVKVMSIFCVSYFLFLAASIATVDANISLNERIIFPLYLPVLSIMVAFVVNSAKHAPRSIGRVTPIVLLVLILGVYLVRDIDTAAGSNGCGGGYMTQTWRASETIEAVRSLPAGTTIYSNGPDPIYFLTGRPAHLMPERLNRYTVLPNAKYDEEMLLVAERVQKGAVVIYFDEMAWRRYVPTENQVKSLLQQQPNLELSDGIIFGELTSGGASER